MLPRFTLSHLQTGTLTSTLATLDATQKAIDLRQAPSGALILTVYRDRDTIVYRIEPDGFIREIQEVPA